MMSAALFASAPIFAEPGNIPHLDHVFLIVMENHSLKEIIGNSNTPFINQLTRSSNLAINYYAIGHPSLTNYLELVSGSNFGIVNDNFFAAENAGSEVRFALSNHARDRNVQVMDDLFSF